MTLIIHLPDEQETALNAKARAHGLSAEDYARQVLVDDLEASKSEPFWRSGVFLH